eukprot:TRINITY_DN1711_c0_g2_i3.p1 TRINITY_DN1711_c0_g2~~TRINITY_DN1711_c0_g2_i3.p1  ORF type:complete len:912 (-),score=228.77 TRINITY_DN1711_c0_g2_i3:349-2829(-)
MAAAATAMMAPATVAAAGVTAALSAASDDIALRDIQRASEGCMVGRLTHGARDGETVIFHQVLKVRVGPWEEAASVLTGAIVTIYAKTALGARGNTLSQVKQPGSATDRALRIVVYDPRRARTAEACITGEKDLRECVGPLQQPLVDAFAATALSTASPKSAAVQAAAAAAAVQQCDYNLCHFLCTQRLTVVCTDNVSGGDDGSGSCASHTDDSAEGGGGNTLHGSTDGNGGDNVVASGSASSNSGADIDNAGGDCGGGHTSSMAVDGTSSCCGNAGAGNDSGAFAVRLLRNRLYSSVKQTPVHVGGGADARANAATLIVDDATEQVATDDVNLHRRGTKIYRGARRVGGVLYQITAYELPPTEAEAVLPGAAPALKCLAYDPGSQALLATFVAPPAVEEIAGGALSPLLKDATPALRERLGACVCAALCVDVQSDGSLKLLAPWSGGPIGTLINLSSPVKPGKPRADRTLARARAPGAIIAAQFSARVDGWDAVVTAFTEGSPGNRAGSVTSGSNTSSKAGSRHSAVDHSHASTGGRSVKQVLHGGSDSEAGDACAPSGSSNSSGGGTAHHSSSGAEVCLSIYLPKLGRAAEATIGSLIRAHVNAAVAPKAGCPPAVPDVMSLPAGAAREAAVRRFCRGLLIEVVAVDESGAKPVGKGVHATREIKLQLRQNWPEKPWLAAYNELDAHDALPDPLSTTRGQPEMFAPGESTNGFGAPVLQRVIGLNGLRVLLTVKQSSGRPVPEGANGGLIWQAYCADTCATSTLHTSGTELIRQVGNKPHLLTGALLEDTVAQLVRRLLLKKSAIGTWQLSLDRSIEPWLFTSS